MTSSEDRELLQQFVGGASAPAFEELVRRHLDPVFSAALRRVNGDRALAEDVTQTVFADFARKARRVPPDMPPGGWLHRHTGFVASKMIDKERRRRNREHQAATMDATLPQKGDADWAATAPLLDAAMDTLSPADRDAIVLRFFEAKDYRAIGTALGVGEDTAQKRVSRAIDKLRGALSRRGVTSTGGALAALMLTNSVHAAPAALADRVAGRALAGAANAGGTLVGALAGMGAAARFKAGAALAGVAVAAAVAGSQLTAPRDASPSVPDTDGEATPSPAAPPSTLANHAGGRRAAVPGSGRSVAEIVEDAAALWRGGRQGVTASAEALALLGQLTPAQIEEALALAGALPDRAASTLVTKNLLVHWTERDPLAALRWAQHDASLERPADVIDGMLNTWAACDPVAVLNWGGKTGTGSIRRSPLSESVLGTVFRSLAETDPDGAMTNLMRLQNPNERGQALRDALDTVQTEEEREAVEVRIGKIEFDDVRIQARRAFVEQWARHDPGAAAGYVTAAEPAWERTRLMDSLGMTWMQSDPAAAAAWWTGHAPGPDTLVKIINVWAQSDPRAAGGWLDSQGRGPATDTARTTFARQIADLDPENALLWADSVTDPTSREEAIDHIFTNWRTREPAAAEQFLTEAGWSAERTGRLRNLPNKHQTELP